MDLVDDHGVTRHVRVMTLEESPTGGEKRDYLIWGIGIDEERRVGVSGRPKRVCFEEP